MTGTRVVDSSEQALRSTMEKLPAAPAGWSFFCTVDGFAKGPVSQDILDRRLVAFCTASGHVVVMDARCNHMGADLGNGRVVGEAIECPYHRWRYGVDGRCECIPASPSEPLSARQRVYPSAVLHDLVFVFLGPRALYPLPFFEGLAPAACTHSAPLVLEVDCPWYMAAANAFDFQHLHAVHDRRLLEPPAVTQPGPFARSARTVSRVGCSSWYDTFIKFAGGDTAEMTVTDWSGSLVFVQVRLRSTVTYGMVSVRPLGKGRVRLYLFAFLASSRTAIARRFLDPVRTRIRLFFIGQFVRADAAKVHGIREGPLNLIAADAEFARYLEWLALTSNGLSADADTHP